MDVALLTYADAPGLPPDDQLLFAPLRAHGLTPHAVVWDAPGVAWERFGLVVVRATWDYFVKPAAFRAWLEMVAPRVRLFNPPALLRWNTHKGYLLELAEKGVPVTPTWLVRQGERPQLAQGAAARDWAEVVVKPAVSGGGRLTRRFSRAQLETEGQAHLEAVLAEGDALVQPFLRALQEGGERSYVFLDGAFSHAVVRAATLGAEVLPDGAALTPRPEEVALAERVLAATPSPTLYARVDVASGPGGQTLLQELEVVEPRLFLAAGQSVQAAERLAAAIARRAREA